ncbi:MAG: Cro/CI family transcriptional regulator [Pseudomonadota bacterium]
MEKRSLQDYVEEHGQTTTARRAGLTQGAIWQMLNSDRQIFVDEDGQTVSLSELKEITKRADAA